VAKTKEIRLEVPADLHKWILKKSKAEMISIAALVRQTLALARQKEGE